MKRVIVDYSKLTNEILNLLVEKFPDGYDDSDIIRFKNARNEAIEAVEVKTADTIYLVKVSMKLADRIENYDEDDDIDVTDDPIDTLKELEIDRNIVDDDDIEKVDADADEPDDEYDIDIDDDADNEDKNIDDQDDDDDDML
jgi:DNA-directed RNA polymerase subunit delta